MDEYDPTIGKHCLSTCTCSRLYFLPIQLYLHVHVQAPSNLVETRAKTWENEQLLFPVKKKINRLCI